MNQASRKSCDVPVLPAADQSGKAALCAVPMVNVSAIIAFIIDYIVFLVIFFSFVRLWIQCFMTSAKIGIWDLIGMKLRNVDYGMIVRQKISLVQAGVKVTTQEMEAHYLSRGNVPKTATAVIALLCGLPCITSRQ